MYLLRDPFDLYNKETLKGLKGDDYKIQDIDMFGTGRRTATFEEDQQNIEKNFENHINNPKFNVPTLFLEKNRINKTIEEIIAIKELCSENDINLHILLNPFHKTTYTANKELVEEIKKELEEVTGFWDFSGLNEITVDNYYWYETSHYRLIVGRMILERIFSIDLGVDTPDDFGKYINRK